MTERELLSREKFHPPAFLNEIYYGFPNIHTSASVLHLTDTHLGNWGVHSWLRVKEQQRLIEKVAKAASKGTDALLFTGDVSSLIPWLPWNTPPDKTLLQEILQPLKDLTIAKYAVFGNHDYKKKDTDNNAEVEYEVLDACGFTILAHSTRQPFMATLTEDISIWGMPDFLMQPEAHAEMCRNMAAMYQGIHPNNLPIIMAHNPDTFDHLPDDMIYLGLAGHTHGAAYNNKYLRNFAVDLLNSENKQRMQGTFKNPSGSRVYVSPGAGRHVGTPFSDVAMEVTRVTVGPD